MATSGTVSAGGKPDLEKLTVPAGVYSDLGSLEITASSSALAGLQNGITQLAEYPYGCVEQRSSRIRVLLDLAALAEKYPLPGIKTGNIKKVVQEQIDLLRTYQTEVGGLSYWPGDFTPDQFITPRVFLLLLDAKDAGIQDSGRNDGADPVVSHRHRPGGAQRFNFVDAVSAEPGPGGVGAGPGR